MKLFKIFLLALMVAAFPFVLFAGVFDITVDVDNSGDPYTLNFNNVEDLFDQVDTDAILANYPTYNELTSGADITLNFRGVPILLSFASNSTKLTLSIPSIGVYEEFTGTDRDDSVNQLEDWYKKDGGDALTKLQQKLASDTPTDPIAGNPGSLMSRMVSMDFDQAMDPSASIEMNAPTSDMNANMISVFARYSNYSTNGIKSKEYALPLAYTIRFDQSKNTLAIRLPMSMMDVDGSKSYNLGLGLALGYQATDDWKITPAIGYGAVGSIDLGSAGQIVSGSLTSSYVFHISKFALSMGNMAGYYKTLPLSYGDYSFDPDIHNTVIRNGLDFIIPAGLNKTFDVFVTDTRYFGSELYVDQYNEVGFAYGFAKTNVKETSKGMKSYMKRVRAGATYMYAENAHGYTFNLGYSF